MSDGITPGMVVEVVEDRNGDAPETVGHQALVVRTAISSKGSLVIEMMTGNGSGQEYYAHPEELREAA